MLKSHALVVVTLAIPMNACGDVVSEDAARVASLTQNAVITRSLDLGLAGFSAASSANIPAQDADGDVDGSITVSGQVDQGNSDNKGMRLNVVLVDFADSAFDDPETDDEEELEMRSSTEDGAPLAVEISLRDIPDGTLTGTLSGTVQIEGDLNAIIDVALDVSGAIESDGDGGTRRVDGSTAVTGTVSSDGGDFDVDFEI